MKNRITAPMVVLETDRLILRPMLEDDAAVIVQWRNSKHVASMRIRSRNNELSIQEHISWFSRTRLDRVDYVIELKEDRRPIGSVSWVWHEFSDEKLCAESGRYIGDPSSLGKGYATEAAARWLRYAFEDIGLDCLIAITRFDNHPNIKVNEKLGFTIQPWPQEPERVSEDWIFMGLTKEEWIRNQKS